MVILVIFYKVDFKILAIKPHWDYCKCHVCGLALHHVDNKSLINFSIRKIMNLNCTFHSTASLTCHGVLSVVKREPVLRYEAYLLPFKVSKVFLYPKTQQCVNKKSPCLTLHSVFIFLSWHHLRSLTGAGTCRGRGTGSDFTAVMP